MSKPVYFKDLKKRSSDLLNKEFPGDKAEKKLEYKGDTSSGVGIETLFTQDDKGTISATVKPKYRYKQYSAEVNGEFTTSQDAKVEISVEDQFTKGLKTLTSVNKKKDENFGAFGVEFKNDNAAITASVDYGKKSGPTVSASAVFGAEGFSLGVNTTYISTKSALDGLEVFGSYRSSEVDVNLIGRTKPGGNQEIGLAYFHDVSSDFAFGAEGQYNLSAKSVDLTAGLQYKVTSDATLKGKFSNNGRLGLSYGQKLNPRTRFTISSAFDLQKPGSSSFGFSVNFNA